MCSAGFVVVFRGFVDVAAEHLISMETFETARNNICFQIERYGYSCWSHIPRWEQFLLQSKLWIIPKELFDTLSVHKTNSIIVLFSQNATHSKSSQTSGIYLPWYKEEVVFESVFSMICIRPARVFSQRECWWVAPSRSHQRLTDLAD